MNATSINAALIGPGTRPAVATELRRMAEVTDACGHRAFRGGRYKLASSNWQISAAQVRAAKAVESGVTIDPRDHRYVEEAIGRVRDLRAAEQAKAEVPQ